MCIKFVGKSEDVMEILEIQKQSMNFRHTLTHFNEIPAVTLNDRITNQCWNDASPIIVFEYAYVRVLFLGGGKGENEDLCIFLSVAVLFNFFNLVDSISFQAIR